jgi:hypothetical protein
MGHRRPRGRSRALRTTAVVTLVVGAVLALAGFGFAAFQDGVLARAGDMVFPGAGPTSESAPAPATPSASPSPSLEPLAVGPATVDVDMTGWYSWAVMDQRTGKIFGSENMASTSTTASLIKSWLASDYLRRASERGATPSDAKLAQIRTMIRDSANAPAQTLWEQLGKQASIGRLISVCELTDSKASSAGWSRTRLSPRDIARLADCIDDGRAAGPKWTGWLLGQMRSVRGEGDAGIRKAFPASAQQTIAIKNGWIDRAAEQEYHVSCLAIGDDWTMGVMVRYPFGGGRDYDYGFDVCESVARQLRTDT